MLIAVQGCIIWDNIKMADKPWTRLRGLLGRKGLEPGEGLLLTPCNQVHGFFMKFPIDLVFLDRQGRVILTDRLDPWQISPLVRKAHAVLEVATGSIDHRVVPGVQLDQVNRISGG